jgi:predicted nucleotidyltransferase
MRERLRRLYGATQVLGHYAVSRLTGGVWETNLCKRFDFSKLRRMQAQIMQRTAKSRADEVEARRGLGFTDE